MSAGPKDLLGVARLLRDRDLADLSRAHDAVTAARRVEKSVAGDIAARRSALRDDPGLEAARPGAFATWLRHARREEARLAARREIAVQQEAALRERAQRSFGRVTALEALAARAPRRKPVS